LQGAQAQRPFFVVSSVGCSNSVGKKRSATTGCANTPSQSANYILEDWATLIAIQGRLFFGKKVGVLI
jgi:hypothetical protein